MSQNKSNEFSFFNFAVVAAVLGGVGAAVMSHPKGKHIRESLKVVGDDIVDVVEKTIDNVQDKKQGTEPIDVSDLLVSLFEELHEMNKVAHDDMKSPLTVESAKERVLDTIQKVENSAEEVVEDFSKKVSWLQRTGRTLAKRGMKDY